MSVRFVNYIKRFKSRFKSGNHDVSEQASDYLSGLLQSDKRNMERITEAVPETDYQVLQNFLTHSSWDERAVMDQLALEVDDCFGGDEGTGLYIDETAMTKKGKKSAGVARQWSGRLGKKENCQVGVFGALGKDDQVSLIDARLYLPQEWTDDQARCDQAGIPRSHQIHKTKLELALEIVERARRNGVRFEWIGMDGLYGKSFELLKTLDSLDEVFMADIHKDRHIYLDDPKPYLPDNTEGRGRKRTRYHSDAKAIEVQQWVAGQPDAVWQKKTVRTTTKGKLVIEVLHRHVWVWDKQSAEAKCWHLIVRREVNSPDTIKYSLSNAPYDTSLVKLCRMQGQRYWIERAFQDAKSHIGMAQYQARKWSAWHRHMTLVMMAQQFMLQERIRNKEDCPLLSCYDIQILLAKTLPSRQSDERELIKQMHERHKKRQAAIDSANGITGARLGSPISVKINMTK